MKIEHHEVNPGRTRPKYIKPVDYAINPMSVWLTQRDRLIINKGDTLKEVAQVIRKFWKLSDRDACQLVAYWFALGERAWFKTSGRKKWKGRELDASLTRRYLIKSLWQQ